MSEFKGRTPAKTEAELQTDAIRNFLEWRVQSAKDLAFWYALGNLGVTEEDVDGIMETSVHETVEDVVAHAQWLKERGLILSFQTDESSVFPLVGFGYDSEDGYTVQAVNPYTQEIFACPISDVRQIVVR